MNKNTYTVAQVNHYVKNMFTQDYFLQRISVKGEVSNCKYHPSGHIYFSLKDDCAILACVMFAGNRRGLAFQMKNGDRVIATGSVSVYERDGRYQLYAREISLDGAGNLYERFLALKAELEEMGMFAPQYKQPIPKYVKTVGIVTASTGAAIQDIRNISLRRNPYVRLILYPAIVQGEHSAESIVKGIETLDRYGTDVIIVGRGGGSIEDLWAFNERIVAEAIFNCRTPIISAVGHETDFTIADFVADLRAPTPSAAAELAVSDYYAVYEKMNNLRARLDRSMRSRLTVLRADLERIRTRLSYLSPQSRLMDHRQYVSTLMDRMGSAMDQKLSDKRRILDRYEENLPRLMDRKLLDARHRLSLAVEKYRGLSPLNKLNQGYSYVADDKGRAVRSVDGINAGDRLDIYVTDGMITAIVEECKHDTRNES